MEPLTVDVAVQHHPDRADLVERLLRAFDAPPRVVTDPDPDSPVRSALRTYVACLESVAADATHLLVIQDDAVVCDRFTERMHAAVAEHPDALVPLFVPGVGAHRTAVLQAQRRGERWARLPHMWTPTVATVWPVARAAEFLAWLTEHRYDPHGRHRGDDGPVGKWVQRSRVAVWAPVPSLVQHPDDTPSLIGRRAGYGRNRSRVAAVYDA